MVDYSQSSIAQWETVGGVLILGGVAIERMSCRFRTASFAHRESLLHILKLECQDGECNDPVCNNGDFKAVKKEPRSFRWAGEVLTRFRSTAR